MPAHRAGLGGCALEHLGRQGFSAQDAMEQLARYATVTNEQRHLAKHIRLHYLRNATRFFQPLSQHFKLQDRLSVIIREGYRTRNPCNTRFWHDSKELAQYTTTPGPDVEQHIERSSAAGMTLLGISGMGKSTAIEEILLNIYPQTIFHSAYYYSEGLKTPPNGHGNPL
jgi:hypothetical protein